MSHSATSSPARASTDRLTAFLQIMDDLKPLGLGNSIALPQIIVCGDQSCGKSSLLESITGVQFPTKDGLCTRFATELQLRVAPVTSTEAYIDPGPERTPAEVEELRAFRPQLDGLNTFADLVAQATQTMASGGGKKFFTDVLRVRHSGPALINLSLIDLPGLFNTAAPGQTVDDASEVKLLVQRFMQNPRSIIVAVLSGRAELASQIVTHLTQVADPERRRTIGVVTKPDELEGHEVQQAQFLQVLKNKTYAYRHGWHVVRNRNQRESTMSAAERDTMEREYLSQGVWREISATQKGASKLRDRLIALYHDHVMEEVPRLAVDIFAKIAEVRETLNDLPEADACGDVKTALLKAMPELATLLSSAVTGQYQQGMFYRDDSSSAARLSDRLSDICKDYHDRLVQAGKGQVGDTLRDDVERKIGLAGRAPGHLNQTIVSDLYSQLVSPWASILDSFLGDVTQAIHEAVRYIMKSVLGDHLLDGAWDHLVAPALDASLQKLKRQLLQFTASPAAGKLMTFSQAILDELPQVRIREISRILIEASIQVPSSHTPSAAAVLERQLSGLPTQTFGSRMTAAEVIHVANGHYQARLQKLLQAIDQTNLEDLFLADLPEQLFTWDAVMALGTDALKGLAQRGRNDDGARAHLQRQIRVLEKALDHIKRVIEHDESPVFVREPAQATDPAGPAEEHGEVTPTRKRSADKSPTPTAVTNQKRRQGRRA